MFFFLLRNVVVKCNVRISCVVRVERARLVLSSLVLLIIDNFKSIT